jgi:hypothetical protein
MAFILPSEIFIETIIEPKKQVQVDLFDKSKLASPFL